MMQNHKRYQVATPGPFVVQSFFEQTTKAYNRDLEKEKSRMQGLGIFL